MFLAKTWLVEARLGNIRDRLQMGSYFGVSKVNLGGGLALFWKEGGSGGKCRIFIPKPY